MKRRIICMLLTLVMALSLIPTMAIAAAELCESESNGSLATANEIPVNQAVTGNLYVFNDVDYYKFTTTERGVVQVQFDVGAVTRGQWYFSLLDADGNTIHTSKINAGDDSKVDMVQMGLSVGTYHVKVYFDPPYSDANYKLTVKFTASSKWETEDNNAWKNADKIAVNQAVTGNLHTYSDVDYYKFTTTERGVVKVQFDIGTVTRGRWYFSLLDADVNTIHTSTINASDDSKVNMVQMGLPAGTYYIKVIYDAPYSDANYKLTAGFTASSKWETEDNDAWKSADKITANQTVTGNLHTYSDVDYYKFTTTKKGMVQVKIDVGNTQSGKWYLDLYDKDHNRVGNYQINASDMSHMTVAVFDLPAGAYYVKISYNAPYSNANYTIKVSTSPKLKSVANGNAGVIVKWDRVYGADGYYLYRNGTKIATIKSGETVKYVDKTAKNGNKYSYKLVAFSVENGKRVKSAAGPAKTMYRLTRPTLASGTKNIATRKIVVKWNKNSKATGYQVKYVKGSTTKTVKVKGAASLSKTLTKLTKGSTYKVYVRSYKTVNSKTYYSAYSPYKSVKVAK